VVAFAALIALLVAYKAWVMRASDPSLYAEKNDYAALALGNGINFDFWLADSSAPRRVTYFQTTHPGLPLQVLAGALYRGFHTPGDTAVQRAIATLADPSSFWRADRLTAAAIFLLALAILFALARRELGRFALAVPLAVLAYAPGWVYELEFLGHESFALPLLLALWACLRRALRPNLPLLPYLLAGAVSGLCYLNKLNYVAWTGATTIALAFYALRSDARWSRRLTAVAANLAGIALAIVGLGRAILGSVGFHDMVETHRSVLLRTGMYGATGTEDVVSLPAALDNLAAFLRLDPVFALWLLAMLAVLVAGVASALRDRTASREESLRVGATLLFLATAFTLGFLAAMKHYYPHYLVPAALAVAFVPLALGQRLSPTWRAAILVGTAAVAMRTGISEVVRVSDEIAERRAYAAEVRQVRELPVLPGFLRFWTYRVPCPEYKAQFVAENSGYPELAESFYVHYFPSERSSFNEIPFELPWQYAVFTKESLPDWSNLPEVLIWKSEVVYRGERLLVLRRKGA
jgi:hypothetical protein